LINAGAAQAQSSVRYQVSYANDPDEAEAMVGRVFLPNRLKPRQPTARLAAQLGAGHVGSVALAYLFYGADVCLVTDEAANYHVDLPVHGRGVLAGTPGAELVTATTERAAVFDPGRAAMLDWPGDCGQLCVMYRRADLIDELESLLGRPLRKRLEFEAGMDVTTLGGRSWVAAMRFGMRQLQRGDVALRHPLAVKALEAVLIDGLLLGQVHSYTAELNAPAPASSNAAIRRAVELLEDEPDRAWSAGSLAREALLSVRSLHEGFRCDVGISPMSYLKEVRLRRAHQDLIVADPATTSVREVAARWGFGHHGRFSAAYRVRYGCSPSDSLHGRR
jgi:AraC-like DNA-binding protein